jgi:predicted nucleotidyltransferase
MVKTKNRLTPYERIIISNLISYLKDFESVEIIILYGSRDKGISDEFSDIDIAVIVKSSLMIKETEKAIERWNIEFAPELMIHSLVVDADSLKSTSIGHEIRKGDILWLRHHKKPRTSSV